MPARGAEGGYVKGDVALSACIARPPRLTKREKALLFGSLATSVHSASWSRTHPFPGHASFTNHQARLDGLEHLAGNSSCKPFFFSYPYLGMAFFCPFLSCFLPSLSSFSAIVVQRTFVMWIDRWGGGPSQAHTSHTRYTPPTDRASILIAEE